MVVEGRILVQYGEEMFYFIVHCKAVVHCEKEEMKGMICGYGGKAGVCGSGTHPELPSMLVDA